MNAIIRGVCQELRLSYKNVYNPEHFGGDLKTFIEGNHINFLSYTNADYPYVEKFGRLRGFHVIRDPRDIIVSGYYSHLYSHPTKDWPELVAYREKIKNMSKEEGLFLEIDRSEYVFQHMSKWNYANSDILELKMEDIVRDPYASLVEVFAWLGLVNENMRLKNQTYYLLYRSISKLTGKYSRLGLLQYRVDKLPVDKLLYIVYSNRFDVKSKGRRPGQEDVTSHFRKGVPGDWVNHLTVDHVKYFEERHPNLLAKLGYE
jgi:hypothetical protein